MSDIGKMIKNYRTLTNKKYRIVTNFIIPLASAAAIRLLVHLGDIWSCTAGICVCDDGRDDGGLLFIWMYLQKEFLWDEFLKEQLWRDALLCGCTAP